MRSVGSAKAKERPRRMLAILAGGMVLLAGCAPEAPKVDESLTVWEAKAIAQDMEDEIAELLPDKYIDTAIQRPIGSLLSCSRDRGKQWSGGTDVQLNSTPRPADLFAAMDAHFAASSEYSITPRQNDGDELRDIEGPFNSIWVVRYIPAYQEVWITSGSPCFRLPEGVYPAGDF